MHQTSTILLFLVVLCSIGITTSTGDIEPRSWDEAHNLAATLVSQMTLEQKVGLATGIGLGSACTGNTHGTSTPQFPSLCLQDGPLGVRSTTGNSVFPAGINAAASFDKQLIRQRGINLGQEFRGKGIHVQLGPATDIQRIPNSGRSWESFGEDPYLAGVAAAETTIGVQSQGVITVAKHFNGYNQETNRLIESSNIDERTLQEIYNWPFARTVESGVCSVMCSYNRVNGTSACENEPLLKRDLKSRMGFRGWVVTDWFATITTVKAANAGLDMVMPEGLTDPKYGAALIAAVKSGLVPEERVTDMAQRIVASWYKMRQDENYPDLQLSRDVQGDHKQSIRALGSASAVLLRNEGGILPIKKEKGVKSIAVLGRDAHSSKLLGPNLCPGHYCDFGTVATGGGSGSAGFPYIISPHTGIKQRASAEGITVYSDETPIDDLLNTLLPRKIDIAFVFVSSFAAEALDRPSLELDNGGDVQILNVANACKNTVVVIHAGGPVDMSSWVNHPNIKAILWAGYPGQESGNGLADVLFGDVNPSGRMPFTISKSPDLYPAFASGSIEIPYTEGLFVGYKWFDARNIEPLYEFGYGLSYTTFEYQDLQIDGDDDSSDDDIVIRASVKVKNTGGVHGAEIVQAYISFPPYTGEPPKLLRGFEKVHLDVGSEATVSFSFRQIDLSIWDVQRNQWVVPPGEYALHVGASSRDIRQHATFSLD